MLHAAHQEIPGLAQEDYNSLSANLQQVHISHSDEEYGTTQIICAGSESPSRRRLAQSDSRDDSSASKKPKLQVVCPPVLPPRAPLIQRLAPYMDQPVNEPPIVVDDVEAPVHEEAPPVPDRTPCLLKAWFLLQLQKQFN